MKKRLTALPVAVAKALAKVPLAKEPSFPLFGSDVEMLLRSLNRFVRRRGHGPVLLLMTLVDELENVKKTHDNRGPLIL